MAPEQAQMAQADVRNDVYSFGVIMQEMNRQGRVVPKRIVQRCLAPIGQRWQNMDVLMEALRKSSRRRRWLYVIAAIAVVAVVIGMLVGQISRLQRKADDMESNAIEMTRQLRVLNHEIIDFADAEVKRLCVAHWDTDHDGELSYDEAAAVTALDSVFTANRRITSFHELQFFTGLSDISRDAFHDCTALQEMTLPRHVRFFRKNAFRGCGLQVLTVPSTVVGIGDYCLDDCPQLHTVIFEATPPSTNEGVVPLQNCPQLSTVFVPYYVFHQEDRQIWNALRPLMKSHIEFADKDVEAICLKHWDKNGDGELQIEEAQAVTTLNAAFSNNPVISSFDELRFFTGLQEIGVSEFERCYALRSIQLPATIRHIGAYAFWWCKSLERLDLPEQLQSIEHDALIKTGMHSIRIPAATTSIATTGVSACLLLTEIVVDPANPVYDSRDNCNAIIETESNMMVAGGVATHIPRSVTSLSDECFNDLFLDELTIPAQIKRIGPWTLATQINRLYMESPVPPAFDSQGGTIHLIMPAVGDYPGPEIYVPVGAVEAYEQAEGWDEFAGHIHEYQPVKE